MTLEELKVEADKLTDSQDYLKQIDICTKIIAFDSKDCIAFNNRGSTYANLKKYDKAIADFSKVIKLGSDKGLLAEAYYWRGLSYYNKNCPDEAKANLTTAIELGLEDKLLAEAQAVLNQIRSQ